MPFPQMYVTTVSGNPLAPTQMYVTVVDASGNVIGGSFSEPQGRLTLTTLVPVLTAAVASSATVRYTPYVGNVVPLYDGVAMVPTEFTELTNTLASATGGPAAAAVSENYDMFVWNNAGTLTLTRGPVWTNATTRSAGTALVMVKGILLNNAAITNGPAASRGTYVGTVRTDAGAATVSFSPGGAAAGGTLATFNVWNMYNRVTQIAVVRDTTATWNTTAAAPASQNASVTNRIDMVRGLNDESVEATNSGHCTTAAVITSFGSKGVCLDAVNTYSGPQGRVTTNVALVAQTGIAHGFYRGLPGLGFHFLQATEAADGTNAVTWLGNNATAQAFNATLRW